MTEEVKSASTIIQTPAGTGGFLHPERALEHMAIRPGMIVADFGSGGGYFTLPASRRVGENGKVYAIDIQKRALDLIRSKANLEHRLNIETIWADLESREGSRLPASAVDLVIAANILFQSEAKAAVLAEAKRVLRTGGHVAILEWDETPFPAGPSPARRLSPAAAKRLAAESGLQLEKEFEAGAHHYGLLFIKS